MYCFDFHGNPKFKYTKPELKDPRGVAVDRDGNIFVCDASVNVIHVISPTGDGSRLIRDECYGRPLAIAFNKDGDTCVVISNSEKHTMALTFFRVQRK